eukprot:3177471-Prymnesium_polylepis.1
MLAGARVSGVDGHMQRHLGGDGRARDDQRREAGRAARRRRHGDGQPCADRVELAGHRDDQLRADVHDGPQPGAARGAARAQAGRHAHRHGLVDLQPCAARDGGDGRGHPNNTGGKRAGGPVDHEVAGRRRAHTAQRAPRSADCAPLDLTSHPHPPR